MHGHTTRIYCNDMHRNSYFTDSDLLCCIFFSLFVSAVPSAPNLELEPFNCTSVTVRWHHAPSDAVIQGYKLSWLPDGQSEGSTIQLHPQDHQHTIAALGKCFTLYRAVTNIHGFLSPNCTSLLYFDIIK